MTIPAKPVAPTLQTSGPAADTAAHARCFLPIAESALPIADLVSGVTSTVVGTGTAPTIVSASFAGTTANLLRLSASTSLLSLAGRGIDINTNGGSHGPYCCNVWVAFRQSATSPAQRCQELASPTGFGDMALSIRQGGTNDVIMYYNDTSNSLTPPGLAITTGHDYLLFFAYTDDGSTTCSAYYALYDFTAAAYIPATVAARVGSTNVYTITGAFGGSERLFTAVTLPASLAIGGDPTNSAFQFIGDIYGYDYAESSSQSDVWTQTQITELVADLLRSARPPAPAAPGSPRFRRGPLGRLR